MLRGLGVPPELDARAAGTTAGWALAPRRLLRAHPEPWFDTGTTDGFLSTTMGQS